jgi:superkiller protein 3
LRARDIINSQVADSLFRNINHHKLVAGFLMSDTSNSILSLKSLYGALLLLTLLLFGTAANVGAQTENDAEVDPVELFNQGQDAHARKEYEAAVRLYDAAIAAHADFPEAEYQRGTALVSLKKSSDAEKAFRRALEIKPEWTLPRLALGVLLADIGRDSEAVVELQSVLVIDATNETALKTLVRLRARGGDQNKTLAILRQATNQPAASEELLLARAANEQQNGNLKEALAAFTRALEINPRNQAARLQQADLYILLNDAPRALEAIRRVDEDLIRESPSGAQTTNAGALDDTRKQLASLYARVGASERLTDAPASLAHFRRALELAGQNVDYATGYAAALVQARRFEEAAGILRRVIAAAPENYAAHANLAAALDELKRYDLSLAEYRWLRERRPELAITDFFIARAHDLLQQYPEALANYETFIKRADPVQHKLEVERVNLRLPGLRKLAARAPKRAKNSQ